MSSSEYQACFTRPSIGFIGLERPRAFEAVLTALLPFNLRLENTEILTTGTLAEYKTIFRYQNGAFAFEFGAEDYNFTKELANLGQQWRLTGKFYLLRNTL